MHFVVAISESGKELLYPKLSELILGAIAFFILLFFMYKWVVPRVNALLEDREGGLWIGTRWGGLSRRRHEGRIDRFQGEDFSVPAIIFDRLPEDHVVQMFVTINAKHTRLNASHLVSLSGRQLYRDENLATAHDVVRALNDREDSPLYDEIKLLGVGRGRVAQAPLAQELKKLFAAEAFGGARKSDDMHEEAKKFFVNYFKQIALVFSGAWNGRKYSIRSAAALRAFIRVAPDVIRRLDQEHADRTDFRAIGRVIAPWGRRIGDLRFETEGAWKRTGSTVDALAKELRLALMYPEGAAV